MKRFTSLMLMLLVAVTTWAQNVVTSTEADPVYYVIGSYNRGGFLTNQGVGNGIVHVDLVDGSYWYFESAGDDGAVYFVNKLKDGENKIYLGSDLTASTTPAIWYVIENGVNTKGLSISKTATVTSNSCIDASNNNSSVGTWSPSASDWNGTTWAFVKCSDYFNATYNPNSLILRTRSDRYVNTVSLGEDTATVDQDYAGYGRAYFDLTSSVTFEVFAGLEVTPAITRDGHWTNAYVYIDLAGDGFTASIGENGAPAEDLVSYSFYSGDEADDTQGYNSKGDVLEGSSRNTIALPSFIAPAEAGTYRMRFKHDWNSIDPNGGNTNFNSNGGSIIDVTLVVKEMVPTATVNYSYQFNGVEKYTQASIGYVGEEYPALTETANFPYGITATKPVGTIAESDITDGVINKVIELTCTLPFAYADSYANINNWYYLQFHANVKNYLYYGGTADVLDASKTAVDATQRNNYTWGFIGDPFTGFTVVNYGAGEGKALNAGESGAIVGDEAQVMTLTASSYGENGFFMQYLSGDYTQRFNKQNGQVVYWSGADAGSTFMVLERDMTGATELQELVDKVDAVSASYQGAIGTAVGNLTEESVTAVANALATAKSILALDDRTPEQISDAHIALQTAIDDLVTVQPTEGKFYTIASACAGGREGKMIYVNTGGGMNFNTAGTDLGYLFQFEAAGDGKFYMYNVAKDRYLSTAKAHGGGQEESLAEETTSAKKVTIKNLGRENVVGLWPEGGAMIHAQDANSVVVAWDNEENNNGSAWRIVEVEEPTTTSFDLTIGEAGYATLYLGCAVTIPAGVEAYAVSEVDEWAVLSPVTGAIPANEAVILKKAEGQPTDATEYKFNYAESATTVESNFLEGTTIDTYIAGPAYVLGYINVAEDGQEERKEVGLYMAALNADATGATGETHFKNNAHKAYLLATAGAVNAASYSFRFGEGTTGVEKVEIGNEKSEIYDLTGRRVEAITAPGIYVVNGKKVLVK